MNTELKEIWKSIPDFPNYMVSNLGNVKSLNFGRMNKEKILKPHINTYGYYQAHLSKNGKHYYFYIHRLVAQAFIPNPDNLPQVNHKDEDKINNAVSNLEWCTAKYNNNYGTHNERMGKTRRGIKFTPEHKDKLSKAHKGLITYQRPILQLSKSGLIILRKWESAKQASRELNVNNSHIGSCCRGERKTAGNYRWIYLDDYVNRMEKLYELTLQKVG